MANIGAEVSAINFIALAFGITGVAMLGRRHD